MTSELTDELVTTRLEELRQLRCRRRCSRRGRSSSLERVRHHRGRSPIRVTSCSWRDTRVDPTTGKGTWLGPFVPVHAALVSTGTGVDRVPAAIAAWVTVRFLGESLVASSSRVYLSTAWDAGHTARP